MSLPGVKVGPLDPETTAEFGSVGQANNARRLIRLHAAAHPVELTKAQSKPPNEPRTKALRIDEVEDAMSDKLPEGHHIVGATVRGREDDREKVVCYTIEGPPPARRVSKWFAPLSDLDLPKSNELGDTLATLQEHKDMGLATGAGDPAVKGDAHERALSRQLADLKRQNEELQRALQARDAETQPPSGGEPPEQPPSNEPWDGYDDQNADEVVDELKEADQATRDEVLAYESAGKNRKSVVAAATRTDLSEE